jgi:hypothetical protein
MSGHVATGNSSLQWANWGLFAGPEKRGRIGVLIFRKGKKTELFERNIRCSAVIGDVKPVADKGFL